ncbi:MAG: exonuclease SbcCD subunit D C-terminal domain-containing protein, partial [Actinomycetota bacterium]|nr:exonuclease SbcCD subunit D C-terminal domain-containing protein [Actinomycetota bacterium]
AATTARQVPSGAPDTLGVMRLLHTADWHLGRSFHGEGLLAAQAAWVDWLVELAASASVDAIVVAGDLYDRALPPVDAVALADDALARLAARAPVVVVAGNHDSATRLGFGSSLLSRAGLHLRTDAARSGEPVLVGGLALYPIPYLEPDAVRTALGVEERGHGPVLTAAMELVRADLARRPGGTRAVVIAHAFVAGAQASGSERDLALGGAASVPASTFTRADYVALGHLHGPQRVGENGRYAGSPLAFSFSEATHTKSVALVDLAGAAPTVELVPCPVPRPLARVRGTLEALLVDAAHEAAEEAWVEVTLTDAVRPADAMDRLRRRFAHAVALHFAPDGASPDAEGFYAARLRGLTDLELAMSFVEDVRGVPADAPEEALLADVLGPGHVSERVA